MTEPAVLDDSLASWEDVKHLADWTSLLIGNGASQNVWKRFGYSSLFEKAGSNDLPDHLAVDDLRLFERLQTKNFESVLSALSVGITVTEALSLDAKVLLRRYESIRSALVSAVHRVHLPWAEFNEVRKRTIGDAVREFEFVYSTNYDLLIYWSLMHGGGIKDYFWSEAFDPSNIDVWGENTKVLYLHGGLHLYRRPNGQTLKRAANFGQNLLDLFGQPFRDATPLFISEGSAAEKISSIYRSAYLTFAFSQFSKDSGPLVVFGHSLSPADKHLTDALRSIPGRRMAVSVRSSSGSIRERKAQLIALFPHTELTFFSAETYPLGLSELEVTDAG